MSKRVEGPADIPNFYFEMGIGLALKAASEKLIKEHLRDGSPVYIWHDGQVVALQGQELQDLLSKISAE